MKACGIKFILLLWTCCISGVHCALKFQQWFPAKSEHIFHNISVINCSTTLKAYEDAFFNLSRNAQIDIDFGLNQNPIYDLCYDHERCMLEKTPADINAILQSSAVILGLLPTLLAVLSPSIAEMALLSTHRPFLSIIITLGSPGVLQTRIFEYSDPARILGPAEVDTSSGLTDTRLKLGPWDKNQATLLSITQYILALGSTVNCLWLAVELGTKSILNWGCTKTWPPILWALCPLLIHGCAAMGYRLALHQSSKRRKLSVPIPKMLSRSLGIGEKGDPDEKMDAAVTTSTTATYKPPRKRTLGEKFRSAIKREFTPSVLHSPTLNLRLPRNERDVRMIIAMCLHCFAGWMSFMHLLFGTVTFSSLLFIHAVDAIGDVAMRFLVSAMICRWIVLVEIAGMRSARINVSVE